MAVFFRWEQDWVTRAAWGGGGGGGHRGTWESKGRFTCTLDHQPGFDFTTYKDSSGEKILQEGLLKACFVLEMLRYLYLMHTSCKCCWNGFLKMSILKDGWKIIFADLIT